MTYRQYDPPDPYRLIKCQECGHVWCGIPGTTCPRCEKGVGVA